MDPSPDAPGGAPPPAGGLVLRPFRALRYDPALVGDLAAVLAPPYDVIDADARARLAGRSPYNVVRLTLPEAPAGADGYEQAAHELRRWQDEGVLRRDRAPAVYVYEEATEAHVQRGLVAAVGLADPAEGVVLPHENTMAGPVADRLALTAATAANLEPIFLVYDGGGAASKLVADVGDRTPLAQASTADGLRHRLWALTDPDELAELAGDLLPRRAVIADGHHRYATYLRYQAQRYAAGAGRGPWDYGLAFLVDATAFGPQVHPIHRVVHGLSAADAARRAGRGFEVAPVPDVAAGLDALALAGRQGPAFLLADGAGCFLLAVPDPAALAATLPPERSAAWRGLDVTVAHQFLVRQVWGLADDESTVGYEHDVPSALAAARRSRGCALLLNPTPVEDVVAVAAAGERMPRKSTLFTPKPATGMLIRLLEDD